MLRTWGCIRWDTARGDSSVVIAIRIRAWTRIRISRQDLAQPGMQAAESTAGTAIDDTEGWDFSVGTTIKAVRPTHRVSTSAFTAFCAGIAAGRRRGRHRGAGRNCRIMPLRVSNPDSGLTSKHRGRVRYAVDEGIRDLDELRRPRIGRARVLSSARGYGDELRGALSRRREQTGTASASTRRHATMSLGRRRFRQRRGRLLGWGPWVDVAAPGARVV